MTKGNVFVSGASRGIGKNIATYFAKNNYKVVGTSRNDFNVEEGVKNFIPIKLDVTSRDDIKNCFNHLKSEGLLPNILINNAGITSDQIFLRMKDDDWDNVIETNLTGTYNLTKAFIKNMVKNKNGRIINISSVSGLMGNAGQVNYSSSKAALNGFTKSLAKEVGSRNITVNCVAPGFVRSNPTTEKQWQALGVEGQKKLVSGIAMRRLGNPEDIASAVVFLASDQASWITGQVLSVDGGR